MPILGESVLVDRLEAETAGQGQAGGARSCGQEGKRRPWIALRYQMKSRE